MMEKNNKQLITYLSTEDLATKSLHVSCQTVNSHTLPSVAFADWTVIIWRINANQVSKVSQLAPKIIINSNRTEETSGIG